MTHAPSTYKIPAVSDTPAAFHVQLYRNENAEPTVFRSKAVGEPPLLLPFSVFLAIRDAIAATAPQANHAPPLRAPATPEAILDALEAMQQAASVVSMPAAGSSDPKEPETAATSANNTTAGAAPKTQASVDTAT